MAIAELIYKRFEQLATVFTAPSAMKLILDRPAPHAMRDVDLSGRAGITAIDEAIYAFAANECGLLSQ